MKQKIVVIGGGTGTFTVLSGLKQFDCLPTAIVTMADNGGSSGILRDELGVLPPGDIRQCLVALSAGDDTLRRLFTYRFSEGSLSGHNFGNLFLSALEKLTGDPLQAVREAHRILHVKGRAIPVSAQPGNLFAELVDGTVVEGEHAIDEPYADRKAIARCFLSPSVQANSEAIEAILNADVIVMGPGDLYTSLIPVLLVDGIVDALTRSHAKKVFVINLVTKKGQTDGFTASNFVEVVNRVIEPTHVDEVLLNSAPISKRIQTRYEQAGETVVQDDFSGDEIGVSIRRVDLLSDDIQEPLKGDTLKRSLLRHDPVKLAKIILE